jgi:hypothetical protein
VAFNPATHRSLSVAFASVQGVSEPSTVHVTVVVLKALKQMLAQQEIFLNFLLFNGDTRNLCSLSFVSTFQLNCLAVSFVRCSLT